MQLAELIQKHSADYHLFADDSELYSCLPVERESALLAFRNMESCCCETGRWMSANKLKLSQQKTEVVVSGPSCIRESVPFDTLAVGEARIHFLGAVELLGAHACTLRLLCHWRSRFPPLSELTFRTHSHFNCSGVVGSTS